MAALPGPVPPPETIGIVEPTGPLPTVPIPQGPTNKELIDFGYMVIGLSDSMFGRTDEEYASGMILLRAMMMEFPFDCLGYDHTSARPAERSGIEARWVTAVGCSLGERIAATLPGKSLLPQFQKTKARAFSALSAAANNPPAMRFADGTPAGAGNNRSRLSGSPFIYGGR